MLEFKLIHRTGYSATDEVTYQAESKERPTEAEVEAWIEKNFNPMGYGPSRYSIAQAHDCMWYASVIVRASTGD